MTLTLSNGETRELVHGVLTGLAGFILLSGTLAPGAVAQGGGPEYRIEDVGLPVGEFVPAVNASGQVEATVAGNPTPQLLGQFQLANFVNEAGLDAIGDNLLLETEASGSPTTGNPPPFASLTFATEVPYFLAIDASVSPGPTRWMRHVLRLSAGITAIILSISASVPRGTRIAYPAGASFFSRAGLRSWISFTGRSTASATCSSGRATRRSVAAPRC